MSSSSPQCKVVFVLGGPGAGKGTQCSFLVGDSDLYGANSPVSVAHLSAGDLLRDARTAGDELGKLIDDYIKEGKIVPVQITIELLQREMQKRIANEKNKKNFMFLIDGFPRNEDNLKGWEEQMKNEKNVSVEFCLFYDCPEHVMEARLLERGKTSGRSDDNVEAIKKRFKVYAESTVPIINHFKAQNKLAHIIADRSPEEIRLETKGIFDKISWS